MEGRGATIDFSNHKDFLSNEVLEASEDELIAVQRYLSDEYVPTSNAKRLAKMGPRNRVKASYIFRTFSVGGADEVRELARMVEPHVGEEVESYIAELGVSVSPYELAIAKCVWFTEDRMVKRHEALTIFPRQTHPINVFYEVHDGTLYWPDNVSLHIRRQMVLERTLERLQSGAQPETILQREGLEWILNRPSYLDVEEGTSQFTSKTIVSLTWFGKGSVKISSKTFGPRLMASLTSSEIQLLASIVELLSSSPTPTLILLTNLLSYK